MMLRAPSRATRVTIALLLAAASASCQRSPNVAFARLLDQCASWASAIVFVDDLSSLDHVPGAYVRNALQHASQDVAQLATKVAAEDDAPPAARTEGGALCNRLASAFDDAARAGDRPDSGQLRSVEAKLRALAAATRASGGGSDHPTP